MSYEEWGKQFDNASQAFDYIAKSISSMSVQEAQEMITQILEGLKQDGKV